MDQNEMYETQAGMEDSSERLEKKEQLRAKVQALVSYYEDEKRRNEELTMELERLKAEQQQMQGMSGPISMGGPSMPGAPMPGAPAPAPGGFPPAGGIPFSQRPDFSPAPPQGPAGYTLQGFGAPQPPQGMSPQGFGGMPPQGMPPAGMRPPMPPQPQNPYGAPQPPQGMPPLGPGAPGIPGSPGGFQPQPPAPQPQSPFGAPPSPFGQPPAPQPFGQPGFGAGPQGMYPPQPPAYQGQGMGLTENIGTVLQTITQVRAKLHQFESIRGYGYPQQPAYVDYDTVALLDKLYDQLGDLSRELMQRR